MDYEKMKKADLVKIARTYDQEIKGLKNDASKKSSDATGLQFHGASMVHSKDAVHFVTLKFDLETGAATVDEAVRFDKNMPHMAYHSLQKFIAETINTKNKTDEVLK